MFTPRKAPEIVYHAAQDWLNSSPLQIRQLHGKIILLDFWTYSCINCLHTLPRLRSIWEKYSQYGVYVIGIHTPEFKFEADKKNVQKAIQKHQLPYPILNDPDRTNWELYGNTYWPRAALINPEGQVILDHVGESGYDEIEKHIVQMLKSLGHKIQDPITPEKKIFHHSETSPETYAGSARNNGLGSPRVCTKEGCDEYVDTQKHHRDTIYLHGDWLQTSDYLEFKGKTGYLTYKYGGREVNVVLDGEGLVEIQKDQKTLDPLEAGFDVIHKDNKSYLQLHGPDMYTLIRADSFHEGTITLTPQGKYKIYAFTFG